MRDKRWSSTPGGAPCGALHSVPAGTRTQEWSSRRAGLLKEPHRVAAASLQEAFQLQQPAVLALGSGHYVLIALKLEVRLRERDVLGPWRRVLQPADHHIQ